MKQFKPSIEEDLNRLHTVTLTEGQISTILFILEDAVEGERGNVNCDDDEEDTFMKDIDSIFETLEGKLDEYYSNEEKVIYRGTANPNATNSEMDGYRIIPGSSGFDSHYEEYSK